MGEAALPFGGPFDKLRAVSTVEPLTVPSEVEGHLDLFEQPGGKRVFSTVLEGGGVQQSRIRYIWRLAGLILWLCFGAMPVRAATVPDMLGRSVIVPAGPLRVVSLAPSLTETVFALGRGDWLVGVTDYCDYPPAARRKPKIGGLAAPDLERILQARPDLVLTTAEGNSRETLLRLERLGVPVFAVTPEGYTGILRSIERLGDVLDAESTAAALLRDIRGKIDAVRRRVDGRPRPRALFLLWTDPLIAAGPGTFIHDLLEMAGGSERPAGGRRALPAPWLGRGGRSCAGRHPGSESSGALRGGTGRSRVRRRRMADLAEHPRRPGRPAGGRAGRPASPARPAGGGGSGAAGSDSPPRPVRAGADAMSRGRTVALPPRRVGAFVALAALLVVGLLLSLMVGSVPVPPSQTLRILAGGRTGPDDVAAAVVLRIRLPRALLAGLVGACLSLAGLGFQAITRNPLADPTVLGVSSGAAFGVTTAMLLGILGPLGSPALGPLCAFAGALAAAVSVYAIARVEGRLPVATLLLSGVIVGLFFSACVMLMTALLASSELQGVVFWLMGNLGPTDGATLAVLAGSLAVGLAVLAGQAGRMNLLALGEEQALQLGVEGERIKRLVFVAASLVTGAAVSTAGSIGFVGLIVPHAARMLLGPDNRRLIPATVLLGAAFLILADLLARTIASPTELPVGVVTAFCGAPLFVYLLRRRRGGGSL